MPVCIIYAIVRQNCAEAIRYSFMGRCGEPSARQSDSAALTLD